MRGTEDASIILLGERGILVEVGMGKAETGGRGAGG
jgi:hypothetical protein